MVLAILAQSLTFGSISEPEPAVSGTHSNTSLFRVRTLPELQELPTVPIVIVALAHGSTVGSVSDTHVHV